MRGVGARERWVAVDHRPRRPRPVDHPCRTV